MAILEGAHILWEITKPTIVLTDSESVARFFQTKAIPTALWNACDHVLQFNIKIAHIVESVNTAVDFLSRLELEVTGKLRLKITEDIQTTSIEIRTSSSDVPDEDQFLFTQADNEYATEEQPLERKEQSQQAAKRMGSKRGTILVENWCQGTHKDRREKDIVLYEGSHSKRTNMSRTENQSNTHELETEYTKPTQQWIATDDR